MEQGGERRFIKPLLDHFGGKPLSEIGQAEIDRAARLLYPGAKPATVNRQVYTPVSAILRHAHKRGLCDLSELERPKQPKGKVRWLRPEEAERLIAACSPHMKPLVAFLFYTGARVSEALYLHWRDVDLSRAHVVFTDTKLDFGHSSCVAESVRQEALEGGWWFLHSVRAPRGE
jgi:integrase